MLAFETPKFLEGFLRWVVFLLKEGTQAGRRQSVLMTFWPPSPLSHLLFRCGLGMSLTNGFLVGHCGRSSFKVCSRRGGVCLIRMRTVDVGSAISLRSRRHFQALKL